MCRRKDRAHGCVLLHAETSKWNRAALLPQSAAVVAGFEPFTRAVSSAELYDSGLGTFAATGNLNIARSIHTATLLSDGRVLVAGGFSSSTSTSYVSDAEIYDPVSSAFTVAGGLLTARYYHSAMLLNDGSILIDGGIGISGYLSSAELYDPATGLSAVTGSTATERYRATATLLFNGKVLVTGGEGHNGISTIDLNSAEIFDPTKNP